MPDNHYQIYRDARTSSGQQLAIQWPWEYPSQPPSHQPEFHAYLLLKTEFKRATAEAGKPSSIFADQRIRGSAALIRARRVADRDDDQFQYSFDESLM
jgi:hypothetical protein